MREGTDLIRQAIDLFQKNQYMEAPDFEIYNYSDTSAPKVFPHKHTFYEIYYLLSDNVSYIIGNQEYRPQKGDFILVPPGLLHYPSEVHITPDQNYSRIVLWCNIDFFERFIATDPAINHMWDVVIENNSYHIHPTAGASAHLYDQFLRLLNEAKHPSYASKAMTYALLMEIFVQINRIIYEIKHFEKHSLPENTFSNIINYIHTHLSDELTLSTLSKKFFVSSGYISRIFREYMGITAHQYIMSLRLEGCRKAIQAGTPITTAVEMYGFHDYSSFYRAFKGTFEVSPREYQNSVYMSPEDSTISPKL